MQKVLAFDLEIVKEVPQNGDWKEHRPLGISCAATIRSDETESVIWYHGQRDGVPQAGAMTLPEVTTMLNYIDISFSRYGYIPLTWNGLQFDFDVLAEESLRSRTSQYLALNSIDMMFHFFCVKGFPLGLNTAAKGLGLSGKTEGMHGALAPLMWNNESDKLRELGYDELADLPEVEKRYLTMEYVGQDAVTTMEVYKRSLEQNGISWISNSGRRNFFHLSRWYTVEESLKIPEPDTSWMTNPMKRDSFTGWFTGGYAPSTPRHSEGQR